MIYLWIKVIHVLAIISWMAGMLYLPRLMVYHVGCAVGSEMDVTFKIMERRLMRAIMTPAAVVAAITGGYLLHSGGFEMSSPWVVGKLSAVAGLIGAHVLLAMHGRELAAGLRKRSSRYFRVLNEVPTLFMIVIVICVIVKP